MRERDYVIKYCTIAEVEKEYGIPKGVFHSMEGRIYRQDKIVAVVPNEGDEVVRLYYDINRYEYRQWKKEHKKD